MLLLWSMAAECRGDAAADLSHISLPLLLIILQIIDLGSIRTWAETHILARQ